MAKSQGQKGRLLHLLRILSTRSDEEHPLSTAQLLSRLHELGMEAERKTLYDDLEVLRSLGYDIQLRRQQGYFLGERIFQLAELKLLVDAVQSSRFITAKKSGQLISKLEKLCSIHQAQGLQRQVYVAGRVKSMNEGIYYNIDAIHQAIGQNRQITFQYFRYNLRREKELRHGGATYQVSPYALLRSDESYYLVAYDTPRGEIRHYRVDKMLSIASTDLPREGQAAYAAYDPGEYTRIHFGMFRGREADVLLRCENRMADVIVDRFGDQVALVPDGPEHFTCSVHLAVSPPFFGWLCGLGGGVTLLAPDWAAEKLRQHLLEMLAHYEG